MAASLVAVTLAACATPAAAAPMFVGEHLVRNGGISRQAWMPEFARGEVAGVPVSLGLAIGVRDSLRANLGSRVVPAVRFDLGGHASVSVLSADGQGAMVVWQRSN
jgi:hypothetical protein